MKLATWNVNGLRARLPRVVQWLSARTPDVACLQEIKCTEEQFPFEELGSLGYRGALHGEKGRNGVAILSRTEPQDVVRGMPGDDDGARLLAATIGDLRVVSVYAVNGVEVGHQRYLDKLAWYERFAEYVRTGFDLSGKVVFAGDFNVTFDDRDVWDPVLWCEQNLASTPERERLEAVLAAGLHDGFRRFHEEGGLFTYWDYRAGAFHRNMGLRIDHLLMSDAALAACTGVEVDRDFRKGSKPSDHAPVIATLG